MLLLNWWSSLIQEQKFKFTSLTAIAILGLIALIAVLVYSVLDRRALRESHNSYELKIQNIQNFLKDGNCTEAAAEYYRAEKKRDEITKRGLYYSFHTHAKQAYSIDIAECFVARKEFSEAVEMLVLKDVNDPDYLFRAAAIYESSGDVLKAEEIIKIAKEYQ